MNLLAIDPGSEQSAFVLFDGERIYAYGIVPNDVVVRDMSRTDWGVMPQHLAIETLHVRGMPTAQAEMETQLWAGRFIQAAGLPFTKIRRIDEKICLCGSARAKDGNIRAALIDRWGGASAIATEKKCAKCKGKGWSGRGRVSCELCGGSGKGTQAGPLAGISADCWSALAVAVTYFEVHHGK